MGLPRSKRNLAELYDEYRRYMDRLREDLKDSAKQVAPEREKAYRVRCMESDEFRRRLESDNEFRARWLHRLEKGYDWEREQVGQLAEEILKCPACAGAPVVADRKEEAA